MPWPTFKREETTSIWPFSTISSDQYVWLVINLLKLSLLFLWDSSGYSKRENAASGCLSVIWRDFDFIARGLHDIDCIYCGASRPGGVSDGAFSHESLRPSRFNKGQLRIASVLQSWSSKIRMECKMMTGCGGLRTSGTWDAWPHLLSQKAGPSCLIFWETIVHVWGEVMVAAYGIDGGDQTDGDSRSLENHLVFNTDLTMHWTYQ